jgi:1-acyl-sn-glycerol-3-phosphate acyltransferase
LFYQLIKPVIRFALKIFCRKISIRHPEQLKSPGPLLVTANHPNSFLDAIIIAASFHHPVHFLARGDAFSRPWHNRLLRLLNMIPVYRMSEGRENLELNAHAFEACREILAGGGIVLIFIEGICINTHELQPFKKGAARIATESRTLQNFQVLPLGIAYDSFRRFGKTIILDAGAPVRVTQLLPFAEEPKNLRYFNAQLFSRITHLVQVPVQSKEHASANWLLLIPAAIGYILHAPLYFLLKTIITRKTKGTVFYDSVLFGALLVLYPAYLLLVAAVLLALKLQFFWILILLIVHPLSAWSVPRGIPRRMQ